MSGALLQAVTTYRLGRRLGHGGFAEVFAGEALGAEGFVRPVAIKRLLTEDPSARAALVQEAQLLAQLRHPNIVAVLDLVEATAPDRALHLVLEYMDGGTLGELALHGPLPWPVVAYVAGEVLAALAYAERQGLVVHRDVTPQNILLTKDGHVKLADFGIARAMHTPAVTRTGLVKGKAAYLAPELLEGEAADMTCDLWSLGVVLVELVTGRRLFEGRTDAEILYAVTRFEGLGPSMPPPGLGAPAWAFLTRLVTPHRTTRWPTAHMAQAALRATMAAGPTPADAAMLAEILAHPGALARTRDLRVPSGPRLGTLPAPGLEADLSSEPPAVPARPRLRTRRGRRGWLGVVAGLGLVAGVGVSGWHVLRRPPEGGPPPPVREAPAPEAQPLEVRRVEVTLPRPPTPRPAKGPTAAPATAPPEVAAPMPEGDRPRRGVFYQVGGVLPLVPATTTKAAP